MSLLKLLQKTFLTASITLTSLLASSNASPTYLHNPPQKPTLSNKDMSFLSKILTPNKYEELRKIRKHLSKIYIPTYEEYKKAIKNPISIEGNIIRQKAELIKQYPGIVINLLSDKDYERFQVEKKDLIPEVLTPREKKIYGIFSSSEDTLATKLIIFFTLKYDEKPSE